MLVSYDLNNKTQKSHLHRYYIIYHFLRTTYFHVKHFNIYFSRQISDSLFTFNLFLLFNKL